MTDTASALLAAIIAQPADDLPRLVYADWLEERGRTERAEFIRVQVELAALMPCKHSPPCLQLWPEAYAGPGGGPQCPPCRKRARLQALEQSLLEKHGGGFNHQGAAWINAECPVLWACCQPPMGDNVVWRRGFIAEITCMGADWLCYADAITAAHPIEVVRLTTMPEIEELEENGVLCYALRGRPSSVLEERDCGGGAPAMLLAAEWKGIAFHLPREERP